jgi:hypothetical protein
MLGATDNFRSFHEPIHDSVGRWGSPLVIAKFHCNPGAHYLVSFGAEHLGGSVESARAQSGLQPGHPLGAQGRHQRYRPRQFPS